MKSKTLKIFFTFIIAFIALSDSYAQLSWNQAGKFNQTSALNYLSIVSAPELTNVDECMFQMWVNMTASSQGSFLELFGKYQDYQLSIGSGGLYLRTVGNLQGSTDLQGPGISLNRWYHLAVIIRDTVITAQKYKIREIFVDGVSAAKDIASFQSNVLGSGADSLTIGASGSLGNTAVFPGYMDDIQMWIGHFLPDDLTRNNRMSLNAYGSNSVFYNKCVLSIQFQDDDNSGTPFLVADVSKYARTIKNVGVTAYSFGNNPSATTSDNLSVHFNGSTDYLAGPDHANNSPTSQITMEAWVFPEKTYTGAFSDYGTIMCKGLASYNYRLYLGSNNEVYATINNNTSFGYSGDVIAPANQWSHIAFTYDGANGNYVYYVNGVAAGSGTNNVGNIVNSTDSLYIGESGGDYFYSGYIDEVRIASYAKPQSNIAGFVYRSMDLGDRPFPLDLSCYNFDGNLTNNCGHTPRLYFRKNATFSSNYISSAKTYPISPMVKCDNMNFPAAWYMSGNNFRVPMSGTQGSSKYDTLTIPYYKNITDINLFLGINHTYNQDLTVWLISPNGDSIPMLQNNTMKRGQMTTIFNDQADSSIVNDKYTSFGPQIKPFTALNGTFVNTNTKGDWKLRINDNAFQDTGRVYSWGLQFNNMSSKPNLIGLSSVANESGFWTGSGQPLDSVKIYLRTSAAPYSIIDSCIGYINQFGFCTTYMANAPGGNYYVEYRHRNSLAVWSNLPISFTQGNTSSFSILGGPNNVYGADLLFTGGRWCMYSGDINQDGAINGNDFTTFSQEFGQSGYLASDLNGDATVNGNDFTAFNTGFGHQTNHP